MKYTYYPGCSLKGTGRAYDESTRAVARALDVELTDLDDWNCCGATAYMNVNETLAFCLTARNLALAKEKGRPVAAPCSACYANLRKTETYLKEFPDLKKKVNTALAEGGIQYDGGVAAKHLLEVFVEDVGLDKIRSLVKKPLEGLRVAPYYGCQIVRPYGIVGKRETPVMLEDLVKALGATPTRYAMKTTCCGGSLMGTQEDTALRLCRNLLLCAHQDKADCIAVTCPLCQTNLDAFQKRINHRYGIQGEVPIVYFTQLMGLGFGLDPKKLGLRRCVVSAKELEARYA
jgi:heterodisulfide reductase subunit B